MKNKQRPDPRGFIRPIIYKIFTRLIYGLTAVLLADFFIKESLRNIKSTGFALVAILCGLGAWLSYLKMDGMKLPKKPDWHLPKRRHPIISYGDIDDHIDEIPNNYDDLEPEEQGVCMLIADIILAAIFAVLSFMVG